MTLNVRGVISPTGIARDTLVEDLRALRHSLVDNKLVDEKATGIERRALWHKFVDRMIKIESGVALFPDLREKFKSLSEYKFHELRGDYIGEVDELIAFCHKSNAPNFPQAIEELLNQENHGLAIQAAKQISDPAQKKAALEYLLNEFLLRGLSGHAEAVVSVLEPSDRKGTAPAIAKQSGIPARSPMTPLKGGSAGSSAGTNHRSPEVPTASTANMRAYSSSPLPPKVINAGQRKDEKKVGPTLKDCEKCQEWWQLVKQATASAANMEKLKREIGQSPENCFKNFFLCLGFIVSMKLDAFDKALEFLKDAVDNAKALSEFIPQQMMMNNGMPEYKSAAEDSIIKLKYWGAFKNIFNNSFPRVRDFIDKVLSNVFIVVKHHRRVKNLREYKNKLLKALSEFRDQMYVDLNNPSKLLIIHNFTTDQEFFSEEFNTYCSQMMGIHLIMLDVFIEAIQSVLKLATGNEPSTGTAAALPPQRNKGVSGITPASVTSSASLVLATPNTAASTPLHGGSGGGLAQIAPLELVIGGAGVPVAAALPAPSPAVVGQNDDEKKRAASGSAEDFHTILEELVDNKNEREAIEMARQLGIEALKHLEELLTGKNFLATAREVRLIVTQMRDRAPSQAEKGKPQIISKEDR